MSLSLKKTKEIASYKKLCQRLKQKKIVKRYAKKLEEKNYPYECDPMVYEIKKTGFRVA